MAPFWLSKCRSRMFCPLPKVRLLQTPVEGSHRRKKQAEGFVYDAPSGFNCFLVGEGCLALSTTCLRPRKTFSHDSAIIWGWCKVTPNPSSVMLLKGLGRALKSRQALCLERLVSSSERANSTKSFHCHPVACVCEIQAFCVTDLRTIHRVWGWKIYFPLMRKSWLTT